MGRILGTILELVGLLVTVSSGWYVAKGPFFGFETPPLQYILLATGVFIVGLVVFGWGLSGRVAASQKEERVIPSNRKV